MRWNWLTIVVLVLAVLFILHIYTSKLPFEQYLNFLDENMSENLEGFEDNKKEKDDSDSESDSDNEKVENFTIYGSDYDDMYCGDDYYWDSYYGICRPLSYWYNPWYSGWYNWYNDYWSPGRWWWPLYGGSYYPRYRRWRQHSRKHYPRSGRRMGSGMRRGVRSGPRMGSRAMRSGGMRGGGSRRGASRSGRR